MTYLTILHKIALAILGGIFLIFVILSFLQKDKKLILPMIFSSFLVVSMIAFFTLFALDKYTKKAKILNIKHRRVLLNESIVFLGKIQNIGDYNIGECKLHIKIASNPMSGKNLSASAMFNPKSTIPEFFNNKEEDKKNSIEKDFIVANNLSPHEIKSFYISMRYPSYLKNPYIKYKLSCH